MSGIESVPTSSRCAGYSYGQSAWKDLATNISGETKIARGETLLTYGAVRPTASSGGTVLASGPCESVIIRVPEMNQSGNRFGLLYTNSGFPYGVMVGGKSGNQPFLPNILSGEQFALTSGKGLWLPVGEEKRLYIQNLNEVYLVGEPSGQPVTFIAEVIAAS